MKRILVIGSQCVSNSPKNSHITKGDILELNLSQSYEKYDKSLVVQISKVFGTP